MLPFQVDADEIARLNEHQLVRLVNRLIWHEARRLRLPVEEVRITLRIHDPDGGADAITRAEEEASDWIPAGSTVWQFKKAWPGATRLRREFAKPAVREVIEQ